MKSPAVLAGEIGELRLRESGVTRVGDTNANACALRILADPDHVRTGDVLESVRHDLAGDKEHVVENRCVGDGQQPVSDEFSRRAWRR